MEYREIFDLAHRRPQMLGLDGSYVVAAAFVSGCDAGNSWRLLDGFREWLATELGEGTNLSWQALVEIYTLPNHARASLASRQSKEDDEKLTEGLFQLLGEFWEVREKDGLAEIFGRYSEKFDIRGG